jgi:type II secretory pathway pseudopilin PulG
VKKSPLFRQKGFTLIETVVGVGVIVIMTVVVVSYARIKTTNIQLAESNAIVERANSSLQSFILLNSKLPCPAPDVNGVSSEGCHFYDGINSGYFPYKTVGLPDSRAGNISYTIDNGKDVSLSLTQVVKDSLKIISVSDRKTIYESPTDIAKDKGLNSSSDGFINFCTALVSAPETKKLPAYTLVFKDSKYGLSFFNEPLITTRSDLFQKFHCSGLISGAARTHANTSLGVHMMYFAAKDVSDYAKIRLERRVLDLKIRLYNEVLEYSVFLVNLLTKQAAKEADKLSVATSKPFAAALTALKDLNGKLEQVQFWLLRGQDLITIPRQILGVAESLIIYSQSLIVRQKTLDDKNIIDVNLFNNIFHGLELPAGSYSATPPLQNGLTLSPAAFALQKKLDQLKDDMEKLTFELKAAVNADPRDEAQIVRLRAVISEKAQQLEKLADPQQVNGIADTENDPENDPAIKDLRKKLIDENKILEELSKMPLPDDEEARKFHLNKIKKQTDLVAELDSRLQAMLYSFVGQDVSASNEPFTPNDAEKASLLSSLRTEYAKLMTEYANIISLVPTSDLSQAQIDKMAVQKEAEISRVNDQIKELQNGSLS